MPRPEGGWSPWHLPLVISRWAVALGFLLATWVLLALPATGFLWGAWAGCPPGSSSAVVVPTGPVPILDAMGSPIGQTFGACRREVYGDLIHLHLDGSARQRGYANGLLCADLMAGLETELFGILHRLVPSFLVRHLLLGGVALMNRNLADALRPEELLEIAGIAQGYRAAGDPFAGTGPTANRLLQYHALHDVSQYLVDNPLVNAPPVGCTAVAVRGTRTADGHLLVGRLFDFEGGRRFDTHKVIRTVRPDQGLAYLSVDWGGVVGGVTGLNEAGLWVSLNAGVSDDRRFSGRPMVVIVQEILNRCGSIDEAFELLATAEVFVSECVVLAQCDRAAVAEVGPGGSALREMTDDRLVVTNHFLAPLWSVDRATADRRQHGTSQRRFDRVEELLGARPAFTPADLLALLRDRCGPEGCDMGFRHRGTINAWIGTQLVVADVTAGIVWVCESPHGLGVGRAFDVRGPRPDLDALPAGADLDLCFTVLPRWLEAREQALALLDAGDPAAALSWTAIMRAANPRHYEGWFLAALCTADQGQRQAWATAALDLAPAYAVEADRIQALLDLAP